MCGENKWIRTYWEGFLEYVHAWIYSSHIEALAVWLVIYVYCCIDYFAQVDAMKVWLKDDIDESAMQMEVLG